MRSNGSGSGKFPPTPSASMIGSRVAEDELHHEKSMEEAEVPSYTVESESGVFKRCDTAELVFGYSNLNSNMVNGSRRGSTRTWPKPVLRQRKPSSTGAGSTSPPKEWETDPRFGHIEAIEVEEIGEDDDSDHADSDGGEEVDPLQQASKQTLKHTVSGANSPTAAGGGPPPLAGRPRSPLSRSWSPKSHHSQLSPNHGGRGPLNSSVTGGDQTAANSRKPSVRSEQIEYMLSGALHRCESMGTLSTEPGPLSTSITSSIRTLVAKAKCSDHEYESEPPLNEAQVRNVVSRVTSWQESVPPVVEDATMVEDL
jgi:hypothetical protein